MAISPTVTSYQRRMMQNRENASPETITFNAKFGDKAYQLISSKYPKILANVITFKIIDSDTEKGYCLGAFIIRAGDDVRYIPVVMYEGEILSAEMIYDKGEDEILPLSTEIINDITNLNMTSSEKLVKNPSVENTHKMFREMYLPPSSSNIVFAAQTDVSSLPNNFKKALSDHLIENPELLHKIAQFYPIDVLAEKLARKPEFAPLPVEPSKSVIKLADLTAETARSLDLNEKKEIIERGYLICGEKDAAKTMPSKNLHASIESKLALTQKNKGTRFHGTGYIFRLADDEVKREKCLIAGDLVLTKDGSLSMDKSENLVIGEFKDGISDGDLAEFGAHPVSGFRPHSKNPSAGPDGTLSLSMHVEDGYRNQFYIFYPTRSNGFKVLTESVAGGSSAICVSDPSGTSGTSDRAYGIFVGDVKVQETDGTIRFKARDFQVSATFISNIKFGAVSISGSELAMPKGSYAIHPKKDEKSYISNIGMLVKMFKNTSVLLKMSDNGAGVTISDSIGTKEASFGKIADAVEYLVEKFRFDKKAVDRLISDKEILVLEKRAFVNDSDVQPAYTQEVSSQGVYNDVEQQQPQQQQQPVQNSTEPVEVDSETLSQFADVQDEDLMDTGLLASIAANDDIKVLLVDMLPQFKETCTQLGKAILLFVSDKNEIEDFYGDEEYGAMLGKLRKIFKMLGELVESLKKYIDM